MMNGGKRIFDNIQENVKRVKFSDHNLKTSEDGIMYYPARNNDQSDEVYRLSAMREMCPPAENLMKPMLDRCTIDHTRLDPNLRYLLDGRYFGVQNPNHEFVPYYIQEGEYLAVPAPNSWDWHRLAYIMYSQSEEKCSLLMKRLARVKLCERMGVPPDHEEDFSSLLPKAWQDSTWWKVVFRGTHNVVIKTTTDDQQPQQLQQQQQLIVQQLVMFPKSADQGYSATMNEHKVQNIFYQHLLTDFKCIGLTNDLFPKSMCPDIKNLDRGMKIETRMRKIIYDYLTELANTQVGVQVVKYKAIGNVPAREMTYIVFTKIKPYTSTQYGNDMKAVEVTMDQAYQFLPPNAGGEFSGTHVPHLSTMTFHGHIQYQRYGQDKKCYRTPDQGETVIDKSVVGTPIVTISPLGRDLAAVDYAIILAKVMVESTVVGRYGPSYHNLKFMKDVFSKIDKLWFSPTYLPQIELQTETPEFYTYGVGRMLRSYVNSDEWNVFKIKIETQEAKTKDIRAINRQHYVEAIQWNADRTLETHDAWNPLNQIKQYLDPHFRGAGFINFSFVEAKDLFARILLGASMMVRVELPEHRGGGDIGPLALDNDIDLVNITDGQWQPGPSKVLMTEEEEDEEVQEDTEDEVFM